MTWDSGNNEWKTVNFYISRSERNNAEKGPQTSAHPFTTRTISSILNRLFIFSSGLSDVEFSGLGTLLSLWACLVRLLALQWHSLASSSPFPKNIVAGMSANSCVMFQTNQKFVSFPNSFGRIPKAWLFAGTPFPWKPLGSGCSLQSPSPATHSMLPGSSTRLIRRRKSICLVGAAGYGSTKRLVVNYSFKHALMSLSLRGWTLVEKDYKTRQSMASLLLLSRISLMTLDDAQFPGLQIEICFEHVLFFVDRFWSDQKTVHKNLSVDWQRWSFVVVWGKQTRKKLTPPCSKYWVENARSVGRAIPHCKKLQLREGLHCSQQNKNNHEKSSCILKLLCISRTPITSNRETIRFQESTPPIVLG